MSRRAASASSRSVRTVATCFSKSPASPVLESAAVLYKLGGCRPVDIPLLRQTPRFGGRPSVLCVAGFLKVFYIEN